MTSATSTSCITPFAYHDSLCIWCRNRSPKNRSPAVCFFELVPVSIQYRSCSVSPRARLSQSFHLQLLDGHQGKTEAVYNPISDSLRVLSGISGTLFHVIFLLKQLLVRGSVCRLGRGATYSPLLCWVNDFLYNLQWSLLHLIMIQDASSSRSTKTSHMQGVSENWSIRLRQYAPTQEGFQAGSVIKVHSSPKRLHGRVVVGFSAL